jgi:hypothetical protein
VFRRALGSVFLCIIRIHSFCANKNIFKKIGPGFVTGAADDDPSGIATYSIAGAKFGYGMTWLALFLLPAMISIQEMCGRLGMVTGRGLASVIKKFSSKKVMWFAVTLLAFANVINIGADLGIMASLQMVFGLNFSFGCFGGHVNCDFGDMGKLQKILRSLKVVGDVTCCLCGYSIFDKARLVGSAKGNANSKDKLEYRLHYDYGGFFGNNYFSLFIFLASFARGGGRDFRS